MVYDVNVERVAKVLHIGRKYLKHIQNSFLEGELSPAQYHKLQAELRKTINPDQDTVRFYSARTKEAFEVLQLGAPRHDDTTIL